MGEGVIFPGCLWHGGGGDDKTWPEQQGVFRRAMAHCCCLRERGHIWFAPRCKEKIRLCQKEYCFHISGRGRRTRTQYPDGSVQVSSYDGARLTSIQDETGAIIQVLHYDSEGKLAGSTDAAGNTTTWDNGISAGADFPGLRNQTQYPTYSETYGYDPQRNRVRLELITGSC